MKKLLNAYENKKPEVVFEWSDSQTEAEAGSSSIHFVVVPQVVAHE